MRLPRKKFQCRGNGKTHRIHPETAAHFSVRCSFEDASDCPKTAAHFSVRSRSKTHRIIRKPLRTFRSDAEVRALRSSACARPRRRPCRSRPCTCRPRRSSRGVALKLRQSVPFPLVSTMAVISAARPGLGVGPGQRLRRQGLDIGRSHRVADCRFVGQAFDLGGGARGRHAAGIIGAVDFGLFQAEAARTAGGKQGSGAKQGRYAERAQARTIENRRLISLRGARQSAISPQTDGPKLSYEQNSVNE